MYVCTKQQILEFRRYCLSYHMTRHFEYFDMWLQAWIDTVLLHRQPELAALAPCDLYNVRRSKTLTHKFMLTRGSQIVLGEVERSYNAAAVEAILSMEDNIQDLTYGMYQLSLDSSWDLDSTGRNSGETWTTPAPWPSSPRNGWESYRSR